ncbi:hypothetical protein AVEN_43821-1 [Araneus ventricosus]|uniref:Uncharacterized protein n=1 Tax=Araneus ventricosus TaxID=182803 RepID=A0A4Y2I0T5_ARAVE|nr:hypothetical protein AVEN_43821-1 [Araneus ventricosus]
MTRTASDLVPPFETSTPHQRGDVLPPTFDLTALYTADIQLNRVSNLQPFDPEVETLPLGQHGPLLLVKWHNESQPTMSVIDSRSIFNKYFIRYQVFNHKISIIPAVFRCKLNPSV